MRSNISFWNDIWIGDKPLSVRFPTLYKKSSKTDLKLAQAYSEEGWWIPFQRNLDQEDLYAWQELCNKMEIELEDVPTQISWRLEPSWLFSTRSLYLGLCKGHEVPLTKFIWNYPLPLKIKVFTWQLARGRLPSNDQIYSRGGPSDGTCALCGHPENVDHIFFQCHLANFMWSGLREMFRVNWNLKSRQDWFAILGTLNSKAKCFLWTFFAAQCWALWTTRNKFTIEGKFLCQPAGCIFKTTLSLQLWRNLHKSKDQTLVDAMVAMTKILFASTYSTPATTASPI
jgi:hypothetical protein